jgi:hypothetical protein
VRSLGLSGGDWEAGRGDGRPWKEEEEKRGVEVRLLEKAATRGEKFERVCWEGTEGA